MIRELEKVREEGLVKEEMKVEVEKLKRKCEGQQNQIKAMNNRLPTLYNIIQELKKEQVRHQEF